MLYTNYITYELFNNEESKKINNILVNISESEWTDGLKTTTHTNKSIKNNLELTSKKVKSYVNNIIKNNLNKQIEYNEYTIPFVTTGPLISKSEKDCYYRIHIDSRYLGEYSTTVFVSDPDTYEGGELCLYLDNQEKKFKLDRGQAITYKTGTLHKVNTVLSGTRYAIVFWTKSLFEDIRIRNIYSNLKSLERYHKKNLLEKDISNFENYKNNPLSIISDSKLELEKLFSVRKKD